MARVLTTPEAKAFYDRFGAKQDEQAFYEDRAIDVLLAHADLARADRVVEFGCGTGRLAQRILSRELPPTARYVGFDLSSTMIDLAEARIRPWADRAEVHQTEGAPNLPLHDDYADRFVSTYVFDLLAETEIAKILVEVRRVLRPSGLICLSGITFGESRATRVVSSAWSAVHRLSPRLVGGCRPLRIAPLLGSDWNIIHREVSASFGISSEVLVAAAS